jgi:hypothetical protein
LTLFRGFGIMAPGEHFYMGGTQPDRPFTAGDAGLTGEDPVWYTAREFGGLRRFTDGRLRQRGLTKFGRRHVCGKAHIVRLLGRRWRRS